MSAATFYPARLVHSWHEAADLVAMRLEVPQEVKASYQVPGQYVQLRLPGGEPAYLAIASAPDARDMEFLIKPAPATAALAAAAHGTTLEITQAHGKGYPVAAHRGQDVLLLAVGTGISAIRSLIGYLAAHRQDYAGVTLFFGARTQAHVPYEGELKHWEAAGIQVVRTLSQPTEPVPGYLQGYVQSALMLHPVTPANTVAFVCGMPAMVEGVADALVRLGIPAERVFQNF